jgi:hypothetical protein
MKQFLAITLRPVVSRLLPRLTVLAVAAFALSACMSPGPVREAMLCGQKVTYHPDDTARCAGNASACTVGGGANGYNVYYSTADEAVLGHEEEHVCGMRHREPWVAVGGKFCTVVTAGGNTQWKKGDVMCRVDAGPPIKMTDASLQRFLSFNSR